MGAEIRRQGNRNPTNTRIPQPCTDDSDPLSSTVSGYTRSPKPLGPKPNHDPYLLERRHDRRHLHRRRRKCWLALTCDDGYDGHWKFSEA